MVGNPWNLTSELGLTFTSYFLLLTFYFLLLALEFPEQPGLRETPIAHDRIGRDLQDGRGFLNAQPPEKPQLDDAALPDIYLFQRLQCIVEGDEVSTRLVTDDERFVERHSGCAATPLLIATGAGVIHEDSPHQPRGDSQKVRAVLPVHMFDVNQFDVGLVDERRGLQAVTRALIPHTTAGDLMKLTLNERDEAVQGGLVTLPPFQQ